MKKFLIFLLVLLLLAGAAAGAYWWYFIKNVKNLVIEEALPESTLLYLEVRDVPKIQADLKTTAYWKIYSEPTVKPLMDVPITEFWKGYDKGVAEGMDRAKKMKGDKKQNYTPEEILAILKAFGNRIPDLIRGQGVIALAGVKMAEPYVDLVFAYDFKDRAVGQADFEKEMLRLFTKGTQTQVNQGGLLKESLKVGQYKLNLGGVNYTVYRDSDKSVTCYARIGTWAVMTIGADESRMRDIINRYQGKPVDSGRSLAQGTQFKLCQSRVSKNFQTFFFLNIEGVVKLIQPYLAVLPNAKDMIEQLNANRSVAATTEIENGLFREVIFVSSPKSVRPDLGATYDKLEYRTLGLTTPDTLLYSVANSDYAKMYDYIMKEAYKNDAFSQQSVGSIISMFQSRGINLRDDFLASMGREGAMVLDWEETSPTPTFFMAQEVGNFQKLNASTAQIMDMLKEFGGEKMLMAKAQSAGGASLYTFPLPELPMIVPTVGVSEKYMFLTLNPEQVDACLARLQNPGKTVRDSEAFQTVQKKVPGDGYFMTYMDSGKIFDKTYTTAKSYAMLAAAFAPKEVMGKMDLSKLPDSAVLAKHLSPAMTLARADDEGLTSLSVSSLGNQVYIAVGAMAGAVMGPMLMEQQMKKRVNHAPPPIPLPSRSTAAPPTPTGPVAPGEVPENYFVVDSVTDDGRGGFSVILNKKIVVDMKESFPVEYNGQSISFQVIEVTETEVVVKSDKQTLRLRRPPKDQL